MVIAFTVLSYDEERFANDIPNIGPFKVRASDTLDFRPRVSVFDPDTSGVSPFDFGSRSFDSCSKTSNGSWRGFYHRIRILPSKN